MWKSHKKLNDLNSTLFRSTTGTLKTFKCDDVIVEDHPVTKEKVLVRRCSILSDGEKGNMHCVLNDGEYVSCFDQDKQKSIIDFFGLKDEGERGKAYDAEELNIFTGFLDMKKELTAKIISINLLEKRLSMLEKTSNSELKERIRKLTEEKITESESKDELYELLQKEKYTESKTLQMAISALESDVAAKDAAMSKLREELKAKYKEDLEAAKLAAQKEIDSLRDALDKLTERVNVPIPFPQVPEPVSPPPTP